MTLLEFRNKLHTALEEVYPKNEVDSFYKLLIAHQLDYSTVDIALNPQTQLSPQKIEFLCDAIEALQRERPIQYILGETEFYGHTFHLNEHTLIPRPETEELVDWILHEIGQENKNSKLRILDIGTGSGCIAISLAKHLSNAIVYAVDISEKALNIGKKNARFNEVDINFRCGDILATSNLPELIGSDTHFDIIVSNPPYVRDLEKREMQANVLKYEPHQALFVTNNEPLVFYDKIATLAISKLSQNGCLFFEINQYLHKETVQLLKEKKYTAIEVKKDLFDNFRMIKASL